MIDLAAHCGLHLDEWQRYVLTHGLGMRADESWTAPKVSCWVPRQNGKGGIIEALELAWLFLFDEELIIHSAHQHRTSQQAYNRLERLIRRAPDLHKQVRQYRQANGEQGIELRDGRELLYTTRSRTAVRGFSAKRLVLDEAQELTSDQMAAILPTVSAMNNWQVWFFGTPPSAPDAWCYSLKEDGEAGTARLAHFDWGQDLSPADPADQVKAHNPDVWYAANPALGIRIELETVQDEDTPSGLGDKFPMERLGAWLPRAGAGGGVIPDDLWQTLADPHSRRSGPIALGVDVTPGRDHAAIAVVAMRDDGLMHWEIIEHRPGIAWVVPRLVALRDRQKPVAIALDSAGGAASLITDLEKVGIRPPADPERPRAGDLAVSGAKDMATAWGMWVDAAREKRARHRDQPSLSLALAGAKTRPLGDGGQAWARRAAGSDISPLVAVTLANWAYETRAHLITTATGPWVVYQ